MDLSTVCMLIPFSRDFLLVQFQTLLEKRLHDTLTVDNVLGLLAISYLPGMLTPLDIRLKKQQECLEFLAGHEGEVNLEPLVNSPSVAINHLLSCRVLFAIQASYNPTLSGAAQLLIDNGLWKEDEKIELKETESKSTTIVNSVSTPLLQHYSDWYMN